MRLDAPAGPVLAVAAGALLVVGIVLLTSTDPIPEVVGGLACLWAGVTGTLALDRGRSR